VHRIAEKAPIIYAPQAGRSRTATHPYKHTHASNPSLRDSLPFQKKISIGLASHPHTVTVAIPKSTSSPSSSTRLSFSQELHTRERERKGGERGTQRCCAAHTNK
jgi:hypothetical protein